MAENYLNLARKWRSKSFDEIVGQDLVIRLLKNSLYRDVVFPVFLFSGPRGCGKTSTARIFGAALNCYLLSGFRTKPKEIGLPCLKCESCKAMQQLAHPDFIEIDAASHTGVDNVRQIIDTASFVPVMGKKRIYLIDEAHMLSKSAFNALLKILEEPPPSALFFLATTDSHKILSTVKSRCFQLFFNPVSNDELVGHLKFICEQENILNDSEGLYFIANETEGCVRDSLNLIERVRLAHASITKETVFKTLGFISDNHLLELLQLILKGSGNDILQFCTKVDLRKYDPYILWKRMVDVIRLALSVKSGLSTNDSNVYSIVEECSLAHLVSILEVCFNYELMFLKTTKPYELLEMILLKLSQKKYSKISESTKDIIEKYDVHEKSNLTDTNMSIKRTSSSWDTLLREIEKLDDPLIISIFKQAKVNEQKDKIELKYNQELTFFKEWLKTTESIWRPVFNKIYGKSIELDLIFDLTENVSSKVVDFKVEQGSEIKKENGKKNQKNLKTDKIREFKIDVSDTKKWVKTNLLLKFFPGKVTMTSELNNGNEND